MTLPVAAVQAALPAIHAEACNCYERYSDGECDDLRTAVAVLVTRWLTPLEEALVDLTDYWNRSENPRLFLNGFTAMLDACEHTIAAASEAVATLPWRQAQEGGK